MVGWSRLCRDRAPLLAAGLLLAACSGLVGEGDERPNPAAPGPGPMVEMPVEPGAPNLGPLHVPAPPTLHRLTARQYGATLRSLLGEGLQIPVDLEVDTPLHGVSTVGAASLALGPRAAEQYEAAALELAGQVFADPARREALVGCAPRSADDPCITTFLERFGRRAFRRPLDPDTLQRWLGVVRSVAGSFRDPSKGLELAVAGMLQSPRFLYRVEQGLPEGTERLRYDGWEMAARLSYFIWGTTPDDALLDAAAAGELDTAEGVAAAARRLLADPRARTALVAFFMEHLKLDRLESITKDAESFPQMSPTLAASMAREVELLVDHLIFGEEADVRALLDAPVGFANDELARLYHLPGVRGPEHVRVEHPANSPRAGVLTTAAFLALNAHANLTSPTLRGRYVVQSLLCQEIPPPPPGVTTTLPEPNPEAGPQTLRQRLEELHFQNPTCAGCHLRMDPIGFAFETFDALGVYRTTDNGLPIDPRGSLGAAEFRSAKELVSLLAAREDVPACLARMAFRYATGHLETPGHRRLLTELMPSFASSGYRFGALVEAIVTSDAFRQASRPE